MTSSACVLQVSAVFFVIAVVFIPIGAACLAASAGVSHQAVYSLAEWVYSHKLGLQVVEVAARYDDQCISGHSNADKDRSLVQVWRPLQQLAFSESCSTSSWSCLQLEGVGTSCHVTLTAPRHMKPPIYLYYELENYYQNHRRYVAACALLGHLISVHIAKFKCVLCHKTTINKYLAPVASLCFAQTWH